MMACLLVLFLDLNANAVLVSSFSIAFNCLDEDSKIDESYRARQCSPLAGIFAIIGPVGREIQGESSFRW